MSDEVVMSGELTQQDVEYHTKFAKECFNQVWTLLENEDRTVEEDDEMVHAAHASRYHWGKIGKPVNLARGEWQISRVYSDLNSADSAKYHALRCLSICQDNELSAFDHAYAYEALARAASVARHKADRDHFLALAREAGEQIEEPDHKKLLFDDLATIS